MSIAVTVKYFLSLLEVKYQVLIHPRVGTPLQTALSANIEPKQLAYAILLKDREKFLIAILPASNILDIQDMNNQLHRKFIPATLSEEKHVFKDCTLGMVPPLGEAYGIDAIVDKSLDNLPTIYMPTGNNSTLICLSNDDFQLAQVNAMHGMTISKNNYQFNDEPSAHPHLYAG
ncbi:MAG: YbaK/EbsC family protein [Gammaproteobacteria bacterium]|nr:YbaK/EbsC family protein [Gammaproteobacteria bacterium]